MKNYFQKNPLASVIALIVLLLIVGGIYSAARHTSVPASPIVNATSTTATSTPELTIATSTFAYSVTTASSTYSQNRPITIVISVLNLTDVAQTLNFKNGCEADYTIAGFDMLAHTTCLVAPASFVVQPHNIRQVTVVHYPSVYQIPVGAYKLTGTIIGYGGMSVPITITQ